MSSSDEYRELKQNALDALRDLLRESEPGTGIYLHNTYAQLKAELNRPAAGAPGRRPTVDPEREEMDRRMAEWRENRARWGSLSLPQREHLLIELLGEKRLAVAQLVDKVEEKFGESAVTYGDVYVVLKHMHARGELDRDSEAFRGTRTRHRYFRKDMSGPIVELERTFHEQGEEA